MKFKEKVKKFWQEHKIDIIVGGILTGTIIVGLIFAAKKDDDYDYDYDSFEDSWIPDKSNNACESNSVSVDESDNACESNSVSVDDFCTRNWNEELYRENWDKVNEFAKTLKLHKGESYILDDSQQFYDEPWYDEEKDGHAIVSHMLNGDGCYPPENKEEEDA